MAVYHSYKEPTRLGKPLSIHPYRIYQPAYFFLPPQDNISEAKTENAFFLLHLWHIRYNRMNFPCESKISMILPRQKKERRYSFLMDGWENINAAQGTFLKETGWKVKGTADSEAEAEIENGNDGIFAVALSLLIH